MMRRSVGEESTFIWAGDGTADAAAAVECVWKTELRAGVKECVIGRVDSRGMPGVSINFNLAETVSRRVLAESQRRTNVSLERLATGKKINRASDDPAGLVGSEALKFEQKSVLGKIQVNVREGQRYAAIDGALSGVTDLVENLKSNVVLAANTGGLSKDEREALQTETNGIIDGLAHLATFTYNGEQVLAPYLSAGTNVVEVDANGVRQRTNVGGGLQALRTGGAFNLVDGDLQRADQFVESLSNSIADARGAIGAVQKGLEHENAALATRNENLSAAISQIVDTDYASEVGELVRSQVLAQASTYTVQAARDLQASTVLKLIKGETEAIKQSGDSIGSGVPER